MNYIKHIGIYCKNLAAMTDFYKKVFSMKSICEMQVDSGELYDELYKCTNATVKISKLITEYGQKSGFGEMIELVYVENDSISSEKENSPIFDVGTAHIAMGIDNLEGVLKKIELYGGSIETKVFQKDSRECVFCRDLEGNWLELIGDKNV